MYNRPNLKGRVSMQKVYLSCDIEGIWGNSNPNYTVQGAYLYPEYCTNMVNEVNLVIDLLFKNGVKEVVVNDGHGNMDNILPSKLDSRAGYVSGNGAYKEFGMMEGFDSSFDGVMFIGYHSRSNSDGVMAHTIWGTMINHIVVDGKELGESGINALLANELGVPVILASGDSEYGKQVQEELGCVFVETKRTLSAQSCLCPSKQELKNRYAKGIQMALESKTISPNVSTHTMDITFHHSRNADFVSRMDGVEKIDNCTVRLTKPDYYSLYKYMRFVIKVCNAYGK